MLKQVYQHEANGEWDDYTFMFDECDYSHTNPKGDEPIIIGGFMGQNYVNGIYVDNKISTLLEKQPFTTLIARRKRLR